jgi:tRNA-modifying protein YgfZ
VAPTPEKLDESIRALSSGAAFVDRTSYRLVAVSGGDARRWLNDLVTADLSALEAGRSRRSLLLTPTGRIRADVHVLALHRGLVLAQDPEQPQPIDEALAPYVLSSDVRLERVDRAVLCAPGSDELPPPAVASLIDIEVIRPSMLGDGFDIVVPRGDAAAAVRAAMSTARIEVAEAMVRAWEVRRGIPRYPRDLTPDSSPTEASIDAPVVDPSKGCFLGQESVARIRNLGHPPRLVVGVTADGDVRQGDVVHALDDDAGAGERAARADAGVITSATPTAKGTAAIARIRWADRLRPLVTQSGVALHIIGAGPEAGPDVEALGGARSSDGRAGDTSI